MGCNLEDGPEAGESVVSGGEPGEPVLDPGLVARVKEDVGRLATLEVVVDALRDDRGRVHDILEEGLLDSLERAAVRADRAVAPALLAGLRERAALRDDNNLGTVDLLLELRDELGHELAVRADLLVRDGDKSDFDTIGLELDGAGDFEVGQCLLQWLLSASSDLIERARNMLLELCGLGLFLDPAHGKAKINRPNRCPHQFFNWITASEYTLKKL